MRNAVSGEAAFSTRGQTGAKFLRFVAVQALRAARVFDGRQLVADPVVTIDGEGIVSVGEALERAEMVDLGDVTLLPGLIDTHVHLVFNGGGTLEEQVVGYTNDELRERAHANAGTALAAGITTLRDLGDRDFVTLDLRGQPDLPTILTSGPPLTAEGGHCWYLNGCCADRAALVAAVEERSRRGCDVVKIMVTGGSLTPTFPMWVSQFGDEDVAAVVEVAHRLGLPVAAHCHGVDGIVSAARAGVDTIEHCTFFTDEGRSEPTDEVLQAVLASGTTVSATMGALPGFPIPPVIEANLDSMLRGLGDFHQRGGRLVVGTDAGIAPTKPHDVLPHAVRHLAQAGFTPLEMLTAMTAEAADVCGVGGRKGRIRPGYDADLLAVRGDPLAEPEALLDVAGVWCRGTRVR